MCCALTFVRSFYHLCVRLCVCMCASQIVCAIYIHIIPYPKRTINNNIDLSCSLARCTLIQCAWIGIRKLICACCLCEMTFYGGLKLLIWAERKRNGETIRENGKTAAHFHCTICWRLRESKCTIEMLELCIDFHSIPPDLWSLALQHQQSTCVKKSSESTQDGSSLSLCIVCGWYFGSFYHS